MSGHPNFIYKQVIVNNDVTERPEGKHSIETLAMRWLMRLYEECSCQIYIVSICQIIFLLLVYS